MDIGLVKITEGNFAFIEMELNSGCRNCTNKAVCMTGDKPALIKIENTAGLQAGDKVDIDLAPQAKLSAGFLLFILPLIFLLIGYYVGYAISPTESSGIIGGLVGFLSGMIDLIVINKILAKTKYFKPRSVTKITK